MGQAFKPLYGFYGNPEEGWSHLLADSSELTIYQKCFKRSLAS